MPLNRQGAQTGVHAVHGTMREWRWLWSVLLALALPGLAIAAQPPPPTGKQDAAKPVVVKRAIGPRKATKPTRPPADAAMRPYQELVDNVRESSDEFRDDNTSEGEERDRLPTP